jgi:hypothetical protein
MSNVRARTETESSIANLRKPETKPRKTVFWRADFVQSLGAESSALSHFSVLGRKSGRTNESLIQLCAGGKHSGQAFDIVNSKIQKLISQFLRRIMQD